MLAMPAHAEEKDPPSPPVMLFAPDIHVRIAAAPIAPQQQLQEIRLSSGAKTAIIITAIVVGALIIVGVIALHGPHGP